MEDSMNRAYKNRLKRSTNIFDFEFPDLILSKWERG